MLTREQKVEQIEEGERILSGSQSLIFVDFAGKTVSDLKNLRRALREAGGIFKVFKKRLLRIVFERRNAGVNPEQFDSQVGTVFSPGDISTIAGTVHKSGLNILGGFDVSKNEFLDGQKVKFIGQLPSREVLLGQLVGMIAVPLKMFMFVLKERSKRSQ